MEYEFELRFKLPGHEAAGSDFIERLGARGCDDAIVGIGQPGRIALRFTRTAESAKQAIVSALQDVRKAIPRVTLIEALPDLVGLSEVAELLGVTRQNMRKLMLAHAATFPTPVHEGSAALWHLEPMLQWLKSRGGYRIEQRQIDVAHVTMQINLIKEAEKLDVPIEGELRGLVA
jgi:predicted DNA-binding transcriptional regulator AlpA